jgi:hypothetical protein
MVLGMFNSYSSAIYEIVSGSPTQTFLEQWANIVYSQRNVPNFFDADAI